MDFNASFDRLISPKVEGGFTLNPKDSGNWTGGKIGVGELKGSNFGISAAAYPHLDIKNLTREKVRPLYLNAYWNEAGCDSVPEGLKYDLFDFAVNSGPSRAKKMLQRTVGAEEDGAIGPKTLLLVNSMNIWELRFKYMAHRMIVMKGSSNLRDSAGGWLARLSSIALEV